jgi:hypothetical protein
MTSHITLKPYQFLNWLAILIGGLAFAPFYALALVALLEHANLTGGFGQGLALGALLPYYLVSRYLFSSAGVYLAVTLVTLILAIGALKWGQPGRPARISALTVVVAVLAFPVLHRYTPPLNAAPDYEMRVVTQPSFVDSVVKMSHAVSERRPCEYTLLGWSEDNRLHYQAECGDVAYWRYDPVSGRQERITAVPAGLNQTLVSEKDVLAMVRADGVRPKEYEPTTRPIYVRSQGYVSPDGQWTGVITRHLYGPEDVVVLNKSHPKRKIWKYS